MEKVKKAQEQLAQMMRKYVDTYFSSLVVLAIDIVISLAGSILAILLGRLCFSPAPTARFAFAWVLVALFAAVCFFILLKTYRVVIRHSTLRDIANVAFASVCKVLITLLAVRLMKPDSQYADKVYFIALFDFALTFALLVLARSMTLLAYEFIKGRLRKAITESIESAPILVYGIGNKAISLVTRLQNSPHYNIKGFIVYGERRNNYKISDLPVHTFTEKGLTHLVCLRDIKAILFSSSLEAGAEQDRLIKYAVQKGIKILFAPSIDEAVDGKMPSQQVRELRIEDLLGRKEINIFVDEISANINGKTVMITGAAGSIGSELCRQLIKLGVQKLILFDNAETPMHNLRLELDAKYPKLDFEPMIGDVRTPARLDLAFRLYKPQIVFHAAAYKHVPLMEENPCEAVFVNVIGTRNVADMCLKYGVEKMVMISTDKAVNPTNVMGCTKRLAEIYVQSLGLAVEKGEVEGHTKFITTRFGNVLGSNGSVIPRFREQIAAGGPVTVTHPDIVRFFMTIPEACRLVMEAATISSGNQIMVFDMGEPVKIDILARRMIELSGYVPDVDIKVEYTGLRPGEKLYEEVISGAEDTLPTSHEMIRVAKVREYSYAAVHDVLNRLEQLARICDIMPLVLLMKQTVPEYISNNSKFEELDRKEEKQIKI